MRAFVSIVRSCIRVGGPSVSSRFTFRPACQRYLLLRVASVLPRTPTHRGKGLCLESAVFYQLRRPDGRWNSDQFFVKDGGDTVELEPKPYRGLPIADNEDFETELKTVLARLHPPPITSASWCGTTRSVNSNN